MKYFITGITGTVVPIIVAALLDKETNPFFYFAIRRGAKDHDIAARYSKLLKTLDLDPAMKEMLVRRSKLVEIDADKENMGIDPVVFKELVENTDKILHGAADVRFNQSYEDIKIANVDFTRRIYELFTQIRGYRHEAGKTPATLYYISTGYAYGIYKKPIPEDYPEFNAGPPDNTYAQTKAEAKSFLLDKINRFNDPIVVFEPTIIGGSAETGKTGAYNLHYTVMMLGYLGKLPFLTSPGNRVDIVPVDWVAAVISDIMVKNDYHQGTLRLSIGDRAGSIRDLLNTGYNYYLKHDPVPGHAIPKIRFVPRWVFISIIQIQKGWNRSLHLLTGIKRYQKIFKGICLLEGYFPYITGYKVFENKRSEALIQKYTDCGPAPALHEIRDKNGNLVEKGYYEKIVADTLKTGWGGLVDFNRLKKSARPNTKPLTIFGFLRK